MFGFSVDKQAGIYIKLMSIKQTQNLIHCSSVGKKPTYYEKSHKGIDLFIYLFYFNHRLIEWFGFKGILKIIWFKHPCGRQEEPPLDQATQQTCK